MYMLILLRLVIRRLYCIAPHGSHYSGNYIGKELGGRYNFRKTEENAMLSVPDYSKATVVVIGDVMLDRYFAGP
ncbi:MAG: hypothetical protein SPL25_10790, partial [Succinivibrionaceae bacterium]|nr:hypothetical protein [Succinivibrionaceae bacterium]